MYAVKEKYGISRWFLLTILLSFFGWAFESVYVYFAYGKWTNRGFLSLPLCPIYGCSILFTYFLVGTPDACSIKQVSKNKCGIFFYLYVCFILPTAMELIIGFLFDKILKIRLWDYSYSKYNLNGYICLKNSIIWAILLFGFMKFLFHPLKRGIGKMQTLYSGIFAVGVALFITADFALQIMKAVA